MPVESVYLAFELSYTPHSKPLCASLVEVDSLVLKKKIKM